MITPNRKSLVALLALAAVPLSAPPAQAAPRSHPLVAGSSTVFPFAAAVAERHAARSPLVLPMGSGAGIAWFCEGLGPSTPDMVMASRSMTAEEAHGCERAGVTAVESYRIGRDGIAIVTPPEGALRELGLGELWLAVAARVPAPQQKGGWVANPYVQWRDINPALPAVPIRVLGPPATSGTRDAFVELALRPACGAALAGAPDETHEHARCGEVRRDGAWQEAGENDDGLVARLQHDRNAVGVVGYGAVLRNPALARAVCLDGRCPSVADIASGAYPLSRPLYLYLKPAHRAFVPGLDALVAEFFSAPASAPDGYLAQLGLVAAPDAQVQPPAAVQPPDLPPANWRWRVASGVLLAVLSALALGLVLVRRAVPVDRRLERAVGVTLWSGAALTAALLAVVLATLVIPTLNFFLQVSPLAFFGGTHWSPESAIRVSQVIGEGAFGVLPVLFGSVLVAAIALALALPLALAAAVHAHAWAGPRFRAGWRVGIRLAALVPAVVFGLFAALTAAPAIASAARGLGAPEAAAGILAAGLVVGIMLLPVLALRLGEALETVPGVAAEAALGLGATRWEVLRDILLPGAASGIGAAVLLAVTRALGETVIVLMALGLVASWSVSPWQSGTTLTAQMVALVTGTHELDNVRTQLPFVLGLTLAMIVLPLNAWALRVLRRSDVSPAPVY